MTSNPASLRARATILAPRSWPSRPTLPTSSLTFLSPDVSVWLVTALLLSMGAVRSENGLLAILAEDALETGADLANGGVALHAGEDVRHEIVASARRLLQRRHGLFRGGPVPVDPEPAQTLHLVALHRHVDLEDRDVVAGVLAGGDVLVHADDRLLPAVDLHLIVVGG